MTGALILVALVVLVVPELLSGRAHRAAEPAMAPGEPPLRSVTVDLGEEPRTAAIPTRPLAEAESLAAPSKSAVPPAPEEPSAVGSSAGQTNPLVPQRKVQSDDSSVPWTPEQQSAASSPAQAEAARARETPHQPPPRGSSSGWWVQVGSFESEEHADRYARRLKADGFAAAVSESARHGHKWYRVRVGPARDRGAARSLAVRLHAAGQAGSLVPP